MQAGPGSEQAVFTDAVGGRHPLNSWYVAGWDKDLPEGGLLAMTVLGQPLVLFRDAEGRLAALQDRCAHRAAPLSLGRCEGGSVRCMYHGVRFAADGRCLEIPGQDVIPASLQVRSYPAVERYSALWVWMGAPAAADEALIPPFVGYADPDWALTPGRLDYDAPARLIHDNLLDLSHIAYVHAESFAGGSKASADGWLGAHVETRAHERGVSVERAAAGMPANPAGGGAGTAGAADVWSRYDFLIHGFFIQTTERYPADTIDRDAPGRHEGRSVFSTFTCQAVTPVSEDETTYFFAYGPLAKDAKRKQFFAELGLKAFHEDKRMIEAQYATMRRTGHHVMPLGMDHAVLKYDAVLKRHLRAAAAPRERQQA
jgi:vanillate O-demethylase monooxygenase subunit